MSLGGGGVECRLTEGIAGGGVAVATFEEGFDGGAVSVSGGHVNGHFVIVLFQRVALVECGKVMGKALRLTMMMVGR